MTYNIYIYHLWKVLVLVTHPQRALLFPPPRKNPVCAPAYIQLIEYFIWSFFSTIEERIRKKRRRLDPDYYDVKSYSSLVDIPEKYMKLSSDVFLIVNKEIENEERIFIFMSPTGAEILKGSDTWASDGTFECCPSPFYQLYVVCGKVTDKSCLPAAFCLLPNKVSIMLILNFAQLYKARHNGY